jgi:hypothetical protein
MTATTELLPSGLTHAGVHPVAEDPTTVMLREV